MADGNEFGFIDLPFADSPDLGGTESVEAGDPAFAALDNVFLRLKQLCDRLRFRSYSSPDPTFSAELMEILAVIQPEDLELMLIQLSRDYQINVDYFMNAVQYNLIAAQLAISRNQISQEVAGVSQKFA